MNWLHAWGSFFGFADTIPQWLLASLFLTLNFFFIILPFFYVIAYLNRKLGADIQARVGPNRAGPLGLGQAIADLIKLLQKETPIHKIWSETFWFYVCFGVLFSTFAFFPLGSLLLLMDTDMSVLVPVWAALVLSLTMMLFGMSQKTVAGWFGGVRVAAQAMTGVVPAVASVLCVVLSSNSFRWLAIVEKQSFLPLQWGLFSSPFNLLALPVFVLSGLLLLGLAPMDAAYSQTDIQGGVSAHLEGRRLILLKLGRFYVFFLWLTIAVVLFLGGWRIPEVLHANLIENESYFVLQVLESVTLFIKVMGLMLFLIWMARVNPKVRVDQVTDFSWKILCPVALFALVGNGMWMLLKEYL